jgi:hypothetical protein
LYDRDDSAPTLLSFLIGGTIGAVVASLLATRTGPALRRRIRARVRAGVRRALPARERGIPEPGLPADLGRADRG